MIKIVFLSLYLFSFMNIAMAKELFTQEKILEYVDLSNPFVYEAVGNENTLKHREKYYQGSFDTEVALKYDKKDYPVGEAEFLNTGVKKLLENGTALNVSYRKAEGTQEYNNIKTDKDGEILAGLQIPVVAIASGMNERKLDLNLASVNTVKLSYQSRDNLRLLYHKILSEYITVLYKNSIIKLQDELLTKAKERQAFISKRVKSGAIAQMALFEAEQQIINRKQTLLSSKNNLTIAIENFVRYLNISKKDFLDKYTLEDISTINYIDKSLDEYIQMAQENRKDIEIYDLEIKKINLVQKQTDQLQLPDIDLSLYGVRDFQNENGYKASINMKFPLERRKYEGKNLENKFKIIDMQMKKDKTIVNIKVSLKNIFNSFAVLRKNIENSSQEIYLVQKLESLEKKKYKLGSSNLFMLNQREIYTLEVKKKQLYYNYQYLRLILDANMEAGRSLDL